jgi:hypothetical protein
LAVVQEVLLVLALLLHSVDFQISSSKVLQAEVVVVGPCSSGSQFHSREELHSALPVAF